MSRIVILDGEMAGSEIPLAYDFNSIGREEGVDIHLSKDNSISRRHAVLRKELNKVILEDLGSTNGTFVFNEDGEEEEVIRAELKDSQVFRVGKTTLQLFLSSDDLVIDTKPGEDMEIVSDTPGDFAIRSTVDPKEIYSTNFLSVPEDQKAVKELNHKIKIFYDIGMALGKIMDMDELFEKVINSLFDMFPAQRGYIMMFNEKYGELETRVVRRRDDKGSTKKSDTIEVSKTIINHVIKEKKALLSDDARIDERFGMPDSVFLHDIRATLYAPLILDAKVIGILCIDSFTSSHIFTENDLRLLSIIASQASQSIENAKLHEKMKQLFISSIKALANAIEARDVYTRGHSERVTEYSVRIAETLGLEKEEVDQIRYAALLHDIGKINIREDILNKPGRLTDEEFLIMKQHPVYGARIMEPVEEFKNILPYVYHHHERFDRRGYPDGLGGEEIPFASRILAVADSFDAMTSNRPYRTAMSLKDAVQEILRNSGTQFDPVVIEAFNKILKNDIDWLRETMQAHNNISSDTYNSLDVKPNPKFSAKSKLRDKKEQDILPIGCTIINKSTEASSQNSEVEPNDENESHEVYGPSFMRSNKK